MARKLVASVANATRNNRDECAVPFQSAAADALFGLLNDDDEESSAYTALFLTGATCDERWRVARQAIVKAGAIGVRINCKAVVSEQSMAEQLYMSTMEALDDVDAADGAKPIRHVHELRRALRNVTFNFEQRLVYVFEDVDTLPRMQKDKLASMRMVWNIGDWLPCGMLAQSVHLARSAASCRKLLKAEQPARSRVAQVVMAERQKCDVVTTLANDIQLLVASYPKETLLGMSAGEIAHVVVGACLELTQEIGMLVAVAREALSKWVQTNLTDGRGATAKDFKKFLLCHSNKFCAQLTSNRMIPTVNEGSVWQSFGSVQDGMENSMVTCLSVPLRRVVFATFLATHNPPKTDLLFCGKGHKKIGRREATVRHRSDAKPIGRQFASFSRIYTLLQLLGEKDQFEVPTNAVANATIAELIARGLCKSNYSDGSVPIGVLKVTCTAPAAYVNRIAHSLGLVLRDHLFDPSILLC